MALTRILDASEGRLLADERRALVVAGEFNAGKSAFINALLGRSLLEEGVTPTTQGITRIEHGETEQHEKRSEGFESIRAPIEVLESVNIVDTPGTNAIHREHEAITRDFVPRSDMVLFVTSADRPFTESERAFLEGIRDWGKKVVVVVNKIDILETPEAVLEVVDFVRVHATKLLSSEPRSFPSRHGKRSKARRPRIHLSSTGAAFVRSRTTWCAGSTTANVYVSSS